jgi:hypothetical protein
MTHEANHPTRREFLKQGGTLVAGAALTGLATQASAAEPSWGGPPVWPPYDKVEAVLQHWSRTYPDRVRLDVMGRSAQGRPLYAVRLTDAKIDDADKQHALVTALHSGLERSGSNTVLSLIEWLLSDDPGAREILRRQVVVGLPIPDPDRYTEGKVSPCYNAWTLDGPRNPERTPEAVAVQRVMDQYQPEVHADIHGVSLDFGSYIMFENSGSSYSNLALRPYHADIIRQMNEAALAEGYGSDLAESDAERLYWGPNLDPIRSKLWVGRPNVYAATYCYAHYHTITCASEVGWERSGVLRHRRLLEIGNETWPSEHVAGYPTRIVMSNTHAMIAAYGPTAAAQRKSRVELWNKLGQLTLGILDPVVDGRLMCVCATSPAAARKWLAGKSLQAVVDGLAGNPQCDAAAIARFTAGWPAGQNAPQPYLALQSGSVDQGTSPMGKPGSVTTETHATPIVNGLGLRLRLPYPRARITDLRLNGHPLKASPTDGYVQWSARGCTFLEIGLSPSRLQANDLWLVTCQYDPQEKRDHWDTWRRLG